MSQPKMRNKGGDTMFFDSSLFIYKSMPIVREEEKYSIKYFDLK
jgi:hypothetical protein